MSQKPQQRLQVGVQIGPTAKKRPKTPAVIELPEKTVGVVTKASWRLQQLAQPRTVTQKYVKPVRPKVVKKSKGKKLEYVDIVVRPDEVKTKKSRT